MSDMSKFKVGANTYDIKDSTARASKVDKVEGKGLSTNDYDNTEKGKVADNTSAIEAVVNEYGAKNLLPIKLNDVKSYVAIRGYGTWDGDVLTYNGVTYTFEVVNGYVQKVTANGTIDSHGRSFVGLPFNIKYGSGEYKINGYVGNSATYNHGKCLYVASDARDVLIGYCQSVDGYSVVAADEADILVFNFADTGMAINNEECYPMIRDARIKDPTYVPYTMTNKELTERVKKYESDPVLLTTINTTTATSFTLSESVNNFKNICVQLENANGGLFLSSIIPVAILKTKTAWYNPVVFRTTDSVDTLTILFRYVNDTHIEGDVSANYIVNIYGMN